MIQSPLMILAEGALSFGVPIALAVHQLVLLRRPSGDGGPPAPPGMQPVPPPAPADVAPVGARKRARVLEDA